MNRPTDDAEASWPVDFRHMTIRQSPSPDLVALIHTGAGVGVRSLSDLAPGAIVLRFEGAIVPWASVPDAEVRYVMMDASGDWVIPNAPARFINHSCEPNLRFTASRAVETTRPVKAGDELTIAYDLLEPFDIERRARHPEWYFWDDRWSFDCLCGSASCRRRIDQYVHQADG